MGFIIGGLSYIVPFLVVLTVLVFVHEMGHYLVARRAGVRIEVFSIGFGPELFGWFDRSGTRWRVSAVPLGGYVKMFGDGDPASRPAEGLAELTPAERAVSFHHKRLSQRAAVVAAGPIANFLLTIVLLCILFVAYGQPFTPADVGSVITGSPAEQAGVKPGDVVLAIDGKSIRRFEDMQQQVALNVGAPMTILLRRGGEELTFKVVPQVTEFQDRLGNTHKTGKLGIARPDAVYVKQNPVTAVYQAVRETWDLVTGTAISLGQMLVGSRSAGEIGGLGTIVQMSGEVAKSGGIAGLLGFMALLSVNLGLINLFPIPILDGGHLLFYAAEAVRGRPLGRRAQEYGFRIGLALVFTLMVFATWNDLVHLRVIAYLKGLVT